MMAKHAAKTVGVKIAINYKALVAFFTGFIPLVIFVATNQAVSQALGGELTAWLLTVGIPALTGFLVWLKRNEATIAQAEEALNRALARGI